MQLTPEDQAHLERLQTLQNQPDVPAPSDVADAMADVAETVAATVAQTGNTELYAARDRADRAESRCAELERQVQEANDRLAAVAETVIVTDALEKLTDEDEEESIPAEPAEPAEPEITEVEEATPPPPPTDDKPAGALRRKSRPFGRR